MFDFSALPFDVPAELVAVSRRTWDQVAEAGTWWPGGERVAIAEATRAARNGQSVPTDGLPEAAIEVAAMVGATPAHTTPEWADRMIGALGEFRYVEAASIASRIVAVDTFTRLLGLTPEPFPEPGVGEPSRLEPDPPPGKNRAWVRMTGFPNPPIVFSAVPDESEAMNDITDAFYMPEHDMQYPDYRRFGLHRTQIETVAGMVSHGNECFY